ncbi:uncharacterized protein DSM5745_09908 [Aspergillus mulundensis]|uniref:BTB domain-containing protein n=1 Tax=Aspergillus mulundensis TaxID=1810919 RepID=A0A3D8QRT9_9EURO|nr:hypothetical protein DSM5745_09908 [Aspergillus mulundensis]RDW64497.1 hypothetical protein DSM5745_09908 [Aspergillus mulundensis]
MELAGMELDNGPATRRPLIIHPNSDVTIILKNPNAPFAPLLANADTASTSAAPGASDEVRFLVSAKDLKYCSPFFRNALDNNWKEAVEYRKNGSVELTTEGWDLETFGLLMRLFHWKRTYGAEDPLLILRPSLPHTDTQIEPMAKLVVLADYYQCLALIKSFYAVEPEKVVTVDLDADGPEQRIQKMYLFVAWAFNWPTYFRAFSWNIMHTANGPITALGLPLPAEIIDELNRGRKLTLRRMTAYLKKHYNSYRERLPCEDTWCQSTRLGLLTLFMQRNHLLPSTADFRGVSVYSLKEAALSMKSFRRKSHVCARNRPNLTPKQIFLQDDFPDLVQGLEIAQFERRDVE